MTGRSATGKSDIAMLRTIGEVAESLDLPQHVLRFWETRFKEIDPVKRAGGRRFYRPRDIELVAAIRCLLYREGYTIKGVQRILAEQGVDAVIADVRKRQSEETAAESIAPPAETRRQATLDLPEPIVAEPSPDAPAIELQEGNVASEHVRAPPEPDEERAAESQTAPAPIIHPPAVIAAPVVTRRLDEAQAQLLREVLAEIEECKRLLNLTRR